MKRSAILLTAFLFVALFTVSASAQGATTAPPATKAEEPQKDDASPLLSKWDVIVSVAGEDMPATLELAKDGDGFKGALSAEHGEITMKNIKITDNSFTADVTLSAQGQTFEGTIAGKVEDGKISGELSMQGLGAIPFTGKKAEAK